MSFTATTVNSTAAWRPDFFTFEPADVLAQAAILQHSNVAGRIEGDQPVVRVAYAVDDTAKFYDEAAAFDEAQPNLAEALIYTRKIGQLIRLSREQYSQAGTPEHLAQSISRAMIFKADAAFLSQATPVSPATAPVAGLTNWPNLVTRTASTSLDGLIDLEATVRANRANPTAWILSPTAWAELRKLKTGASYNSSLLGAGTDNAEPLLLSIPVVVNPQMPAKTGLLVDRNAIITAVSPLTIATDQSVFFNSDSIAVRAVIRTGHTVPRPERIGLFALPSNWTVTLGSPSAGTFTLTFGNNTTATIAYNATAATVKTALANLSDSWVAADWTVTGSAGGPYTVTSPGGTLTGSGASLTGGTFSIAAA